MYGTVRMLHSFPPSLPAVTIISVLGTSSAPAKVDQICISCPCISPSFTYPLSATYWYWLHLFKKTRPGETRSPPVLPYLASGVSYSVAHPVDVRDLHLGTVFHCLSTPHWLTSFFQYSGENIFAPFANMKETGHSLKEWKLPEITFYLQETCHTTD